MGHSIIPSNQNLPATQENAEVLHITNLQSYADNIKSLATENKDWNLTPEEIISSGKCNRKIFRIKFVSSPVQFQSSHDISGNVVVSVAGKIIGELDSENTAKLKSIILSCDVHSVRCVIQGGMYKIIDRSGNQDIQQKSISAAIKVTYQSKTASTKFSSAVTAKTSTRDERRVSPTAKTANLHKKAKKIPFYKRWWFWLLAIILAFSSCNNKADTTTIPETTAPITSIAETSSATVTEAPAVQETTLPATEATAVPTAAPNVAPAPEPSAAEQKAEMVWVSKTGKRYHSTSDCSGMKNPSSVSKQSAINRGLTPCNNCY